MSPEAAPRRWRDAQGEHIDVRGLPKPQPLVAILRLLHAWPAEIGWDATRLPGDDGAVLLRLQRLTDPSP